MSYSENEPVFALDIDWIVCRIQYVCVYATTINLEDADI